MTAEIPERALTCDRWYDGSLKLWQPAKGFRATTDAVLLAAAITPMASRILELGCGTAAVSLILARRLPEALITGIEINPELASLARRNAAENGFADRLKIITGDIAANPGGLSEAVDQVVFNPPYNDPASSLSADPARKQAMAAGDLTVWITAALAALVRKGRLTLISRTETLPVILECLGHHHAGEISILPIQPAHDQPASRLLVTARKSVRGVMTLLPPLVLHQNASQLTDRAAAITAGGYLDITPPGRQTGRPANIGIARISSMLAKQPVRE